MNISTFRSIRIFEDVDQAFNLMCHSIGWAQRLHTISIIRCSLITALMKRAVFYKHIP
ncbi:hypothetical protein [Dyella jiangningensis]|nr:hypothetical protein [Dyella jiangningensis]